MRSYDPSTEINHIVPLPPIGFSPLWSTDSLESLQKAAGLAAKHGVANALLKYKGLKVHQN